jgi:hypothetical protein
MNGKKSKLIKKIFKGLPEKEAKIAARQARKKYNKIPKNERALFLEEVQKFGA